MSFTQIYVGGLNENTTETDIKMFFRNCGTICTISLKNRYCFLEFEDYKEAEIACEEMDGRVFLGNVIGKSNYSYAK